jgi:hypothetical protein
VQGGVHKLSHWPATVDFGGPTAPAELRIDSGAQFGASWGHQDGKNRYELEYQHGRFDITGVTIGAARSAADASGHYDVLTANALRSMQLAERLAVYAGLGVGVGKVSLPEVAVASGCRCIGAAGKSALVWQARVGAEQRIGGQGHGFVQLSWLKLPGAHSDGAASVAYPRRGVAVLGVGFRRFY